jgi:hypothetical protein
MSTTITRDVLEAYLNCKTKGQLLLAGEHGTRSDYETMSETANAASRVAALARFGQPAAGRITTATLQQGTPLLVDAVLEEEGLSLRVDALKLVERHYVPVLHNPADKVGLLLAVYGVVLGRLQGERPTIGLVARGPQGRLGKVHLDAKLYRKAGQVLDELTPLQGGGDVGPGRLPRTGEASPPGAEAEGGQGPGGARTSKASRLQRPFDPRTVTGQGGLLRFTDGSMLARSAGSH